MRQVTAVLIGAGLRGGHVYSAYAEDHPNELRIVAVAEPDEKRRKEYAEKFHIPEELQFVGYEELLSQEKLADCAMVCTQDTMHYQPVVKAMEKGYHVLCEKPMSPNKKEIIEMGKMAKKYDRTLMICHVLRYSAFFSKIKECIVQEKIGRLMSIQHIEEVGFWHHAHSFVRGNWRRAEETSPMILQKCCHDMDILQWLVDSPCTKVSSFGERSFFREENAPQGAPMHCLDGCPHREDCAFYAPKFYFEHPKSTADGFLYAVSSDTDTESVLKALKEGPYGRCVFHCDNTVVDHQVVNLEFENQVTVNMTMSGFTTNCSRVINLMGTKGQIKGNMETGIIEIDNFVTGEKETIQLNTSTKGHSGSDTNMMHDFVKLMAGEQEYGKTSAEISVASHLIALAAEESRLTGKTIDFREYQKDAEEMEK